MRAAVDTRVATPPEGPTTPAGSLDPRTGRATALPCLRNLRHIQQKS